MEGLILFEKYFLVFIIYSAAGWIVEEINCSIIEKKIVNRGFLIGPICPIYGFGGLLITIVLTEFISRPFVVFCMAIILSGFLEYFTSYIMEKIFNARWWDYSDSKLNLNGRICIGTLIPFGIFGLVVIYLFNPFIFKALNRLPETAMHIISIPTLIITVIDFIISMNVISKITEKAHKITSENVKDDTNEITKQVNKELRKTFGGSRLLDAFPGFTTFTKKVKEVAIKTAKKSKEAVEKGKKVVKKTSNKVKENIEKNKN